MIAQAGKITETNKWSLHADKELLERVCVHQGPKLWVGRIIATPNSYHDIQTFTTSTAFL